jgi:hypothetical protein
MTPEQIAAYVQSQVACASIEVEAMKAENRLFEEQGYAQVYNEAAFRAIPDQFGIGHNSVVSMFNASNEA